MPKFKTGDRVYVDGYTTPNDKKERVHVEGSGTVHRVGYGCTVTMDKPFVDEFGYTRSFFVASPHEVHPLKPKDIKMVFYLKGNTVHCKLFNAEGLVFMHRQRAVLMIPLTSSQVYRLPCNVC